MGLFGDDKVTSVASTVYNMAGEEKDRPQFLQSLLIRNILSDTEDSVGDTIRTGYLNGPAIRLRQFFKWARKTKNYGTVGMPTGVMASGKELNPSSVEPYIPHAAGTEVWSQHVEVANADVSYWAEDWVMKNRPAELNKAWLATYDSSTNKMMIRFSSNNSAVIFTLSNYYVDHKYVYIYYIVITNPNNNLLKKYGSDQLYIYRVGSGKPGLDALVKHGTSYGEFFPFIPVRVENRFISEYGGVVYKQATKAYKKATGGHFDELISDLQKNKDLKDIDHAYVVFGVSLNVVEMSCKRYLYTFFEKLMFSQEGGTQAYQKYLSAVASANGVFNTWRIWKVKNEIYQGSFGKVGGKAGSDPGAEPLRPRIPTPDTNQIRIAGHSSFNAQYDIRLSWAYIVNGSGVGKGRPGARQNDCWIVYMGADPAFNTYYSSSSVLGVKAGSAPDKFRIYWQRSPNTFTYLDVIGLKHVNMIYGGKAVTTTVKEALHDNDESGFIIPLHYETWRETPIIDSSQMGTACVFIVFNSYKVTKKKWYESFLFRIILVIVIAIVSVAFTGGAGVGLLGAHLSVGASLGLSGMTAAIVGSVVNALAALVLTTIIQKVTEKMGIMGPILAAVIGIVVGGMLSSMQAGGGMHFDFTTMFRAENLMKLTQSVGGSVQQVMQAETAKTQEEMGRVNAESEKIMEEIEQKYVKEFGYGKIDITGITQIADIGATELMLSEKSETFLARTTMTGSDIAEMSMDVIHNFSKYSLKLPDAFV